MRRRLAYLALAVVIVGGAVAGGLYFRPWEPADAPEGEERIAVVDRGDLLVVVSASGSVEPHRGVSLSFKAPGRVEEVSAEIGDRVAAGDLLSRLDDSKLRLQVRQAKSSLDAAGAQLDQLRAGARSAELAAAEANLRVAQAQMRAAQANRDQTISGVSRAEIAAAEAQIASAKLQRKPALDAYDRVRRENRPEDDVEQAAYDLYVADKALEAAEAQLAELLEGVNPDEVRAAEANVANASAQVDAAQAQLDLLRTGPTAEQVDDAEAQVAQAEAALRLAESSLEGAVLTAPFDAVVSRVDIRVGDLASPGNPVIVLLDLSELHVTVRVDEIDVGKLEPGQTADVALDALPQAQLTGVIESIAPVATIEGGIVYYPVDINLDAADSPVRVDMSATVTVVIEQMVDVLRVPTWIVRVDSTTGQTYVHRREGDAAVRVDVDLGLRHEGMAQVVSGLSEGDVIVWVEDALPFGLGS